MSPSPITAKDVGKLLELSTDGHALLVGDEDVERRHVLWRLGRPPKPFGKRKITRVAKKAPYRVTLEGDKATGGAPCAAAPRRRIFVRHNTPCPDYYPPLE